LLIGTSDGAVNGKKKKAMLLRMAPSTNTRRNPLVAGNPVERNHVAGEPVDGELVAGEPVDGELVDGEPVDGELVDGEPVDGEPVDGEPVDGEKFLHNFDIACIEFVASA